MSCGYRVLTTTVSVPSVLMRTAKRAMNGEGTLRLRADGRWEKKVMVDGRSMVRLLI